MDKITLTISGRTVHWDVTPSVAAILAQTLVSSLGPAKEGD